MSCESFSQEVFVRSTTADGELKRISSFNDTLFEELLLVAPEYMSFKGAVTDRCVYNLASMFGSGDIGWDLGYDNLETTPYESLEKYMHMSPANYVQNMHTPLLIIHSEQDLRCPIEQGEQLFTALKWMGREVRMVRFEGQSHGLSRGGHPKLRLERLHHIRDWFAKYLK